MQLQTPLLFFTAAILSIQSVAQAGLVGDTVSVRREVLSTGFIYGPITFVAEPGPLDTVALTGGNNFYINVEDDRLEFMFGPQSGSGGPYSTWNHFVTFQDLSPSAPSIASISYVTNLQGFLPDNLQFSDHSVKVAYGGLAYSGGQFLTVNLQFLPEPSTIWLVVITAIGMLSVGRYSRV